MGRLVAIVLAVVTATAAPTAGEQATIPGWRTFTDPQRRFTFSYPDVFGDPITGTDNGFRNRTAAIRFPQLVGLGGEAVLTSGFIDLDIQAAGGLYDAIVRGILQDADVPVLVAALPPLTPANFCRVLGAADRTQGLKLPPRLANAAKQLDTMRNIDPVVHRCALVDDVAVFHKEVTFQSGALSSRQHLFGGVRFLPSPYSSFQLVRGSAVPPTESDLDLIERVVRSFKF